MDSDNYVIYYFVGAFIVFDLIIAVLIIKNVMNKNSKMQDINNDIAKKYGWQYLLKPDDINGNDNVFIGNTDGISWNLNIKCLNTKNKTTIATTFIIDNFMHDYNGNILIGPKMGEIPQGFNMKNPIISFFLQMIFKEDVSKFENLKAIEQNNSLSESAIVLADNESEGEKILNHQIINLYYNWINKYDNNYFPVCLIEKNKIKIMIQKQIEIESEITDLVEFGTSLAKNMD